MDVYLPADFYRLREDLRDWRDAPAVDATPWKTERPANAAAPAVREDCADPSWRVL